MRPKDHPIYRALDTLDVDALHRALASAPGHWHQEVLGNGQVCWSPALLCEAAAPLLVHVLGAGASLDAPVRLGKLFQSPLAAALANNNLSGALVLLAAGAVADVQVTDIKTPMTALWDATRCWGVKAGTREGERWLEVIERLSAGGAAVTPETLNVWMRTAAAQHDTSPVTAHRFRRLIAQAWAQGVRPVIHHNHVGDSALEAPVMLMLHAPDDQARAWLQEVLTPQSMPLLGSFLLKEMGRDSRTPGAEELLAWVTASGPVDWPPTTVAHWQQVWAVSKHGEHNLDSIARQANFRVDLLEWALSNGFPIGERAGPTLLPYLLSVDMLFCFKSEEPLMRSMCLALEHEADMLAASSEGAKDVVALLKSLAPRNPPIGSVSALPLDFAWGFWDNQGPALSGLRSQVRARQLDKRLDDAPAAMQKARL